MNEFMGLFTWLEERLLPLPLLLELIPLVAVLVLLAEQLVVVEPLLLLVVENNELELEHSDGAISELAADDDDDDDIEDDEDNIEDDDAATSDDIEGVDVVVVVGDDAVLVMDIGSGWQFGSNRSEPIELPSRTANMRCWEGAVKFN